MARFILSIITVVKLIIAFTILLKIKVFKSFQLNKKPNYCIDKTMNKNPEIIQKKVNKLSITIGRIFPLDILQKAK
jgi:hypothetical protein